MLKFKKHNAGYREEKSQREKDRLQAADAVIGAAETCFQDENFKKYLAEYVKLKDQCIDELLKIDVYEDDPIRYGFQCKDVIKTLRVLGRFKYLVTQEAGKND